MKEIPDVDIFQLSSRDKTSDIHGFSKSDDRHQSIQKDPKIILRETDGLAVKPLNVRHEAGLIGHGSCVKLNFEPDGAFD